MEKIKKTKKIVISNQKGGVGKTTTVINLSGAFSKQGFRVLLLDLDPQGNLSKSFTNNVSELNNTLNIFTQEQKVIPVKTYNKNIDLITCDNSLSSIIPKMTSDIDTMFLLKDFVLTMNEYDIVLFDTPPTLMNLSLSAMISSDFLLVPISTQFYSLQGTNEILMSFIKIKNRFNPDMKFLGSVVSMHDKRTALSNDILKEIKSGFKDEVFNTIIPRTIKIEESQANKKTVIDFYPNSLVSEKYISLSNEILKRIKL
jgi:chromosome partitioning protein